MRKIVIEYLFILCLILWWMMINKKLFCFVFKLKKIIKIYLIEFLKIYELIFKEEMLKY